MSLIELKRKCPLKLQQNKMTQMGYISNLVNAEFGNTLVCQHEVDIDSENYTLTQL